MARMLIDKTGIRALIPHAGSMCLLDGVLEWDEDSIACMSQTHRDCSNPLRRDGLLSALHCFEYGAQAVAVHGGLRARAAGIVSPSGYFAALRDAKLHIERLDDIEATLDIRAQRLFGDAGNMIYQCRVAADDVLLAEGRITVMLRTGPVLRRGLPR